MLILSHGCPRGSTREATDFFCRVYRAGATLDLTHRNAYDDLIAGLIIDGNWSMLDALWILGTQNTTAAMINLVSDSYKLTMHGTLPFTADDGFTSTGFAGNYFDTGVNLTTTSNFARTSGHISGWIFTSVSDAVVTHMTDAVHSGSVLQPLATWGPAFSGCVNQMLTAGTFGHPPGGRGLHVAQRISENDNGIYSNGNVLPLLGNQNAASQPPINGPLPLLAGYNSTTGQTDATLAGLLLACASVGGRIADQLLYFNRLQAYFTAVRGSPPPTT